MRINPRYYLLLFLVSIGLFFALTQVSAENESPVAHKVVYQFNKSDPGYIQHVLFSVTQLKEKYGDDISIVVVAFGPGIHLLGKHPERPIDPRRVDQAAYLEFSGVEFHACGNTMKALGWTEDDLVDYASVVPIGADDLMLLQAEGYSYISW